MNGGTQFYFIAVAYGHLFSGTAGGSGGDEPSHPWHPKSAHEADAAPAPRRKPASRKNDPGEGPYPCPVCVRRFHSEKAAHGHMRSHPNRPWRGMEAPREPDPAAADGKLYPYQCEHCGAPFKTRQGLGGHRASHNGKKGCFWLSQNNAVAAEPRPVLDVDLNDPVLEQEEEEEEEE
ncbi:zinc finger protein ZAT2-like [Phragmites australis]|uniref:zinc finger protein ZAT2-like n=1 Tax=Phragmites australis TaxID=29695 RepID=UPI002D77E3B9|nr:zinc finger protein ZAT2-like [Phragmites australis]